MSLLVISFLILMGSFASSALDLAWRSYLEHRRRKYSQIISAMSDGRKRFDALSYARARKALEKSYRNQGAP